MNKEKDNDFKEISMKGKGDSPLTIPLIIPTLLYPLHILINILYPIYYIQTSPFIYSISDNIASNNSIILSILFICGLSFSDICFRISL